MACILLLEVKDKTLDFLNVVVIKAWLLVSLIKTCIGLPDDIVEINWKNVSKTIFSEISGGFSDVLYNKNLIVKFIGAKDASLKLLNRHLNNTIRT